jgi:hypothetical protein
MLGRLAGLGAADPGMLLDDFLLVDASGRCLDAHAALLERDTLTRVARATAPDVVIVGDAAIVRGESGEGSERKFTATWIGTGDTWRCAYVHETIANPDARNG